ncbi:TPA: hypothetical protein DCX15_04675, partial [bacterium]|nr:hypothetical protein [bacterium]
DCGIGVKIYVAFIFGCAILPKEAAWKSIPETNYPYGKAWPLIVFTISEKFDLAVIDEGSGYLRSAWKVKKNWLGKDETRTQVTVRVESKEPLRIRIRAKKQKWAVLIDNWQDAGNDKALENELITELQTRLREIK